MKCPKCGYLGFESVDRCRNCGYDFSLVPEAPPPELPMRRAAEPATLLDDDLRLADRRAQPDSRRFEAEARADLDRLFGKPDRARNGAVAPSPASDDAAPAAELPLFGGPITDDVPLITRASPPRQPLSVRRATPEVPRLKAEAPRPALLDLDLPAVVDRAADESDLRAVPASEDAPLAARFVAMAIDLFILAVVDLVVIYFTMQICGLTIQDLGMLPKGPLIAFLLLQNGGYLVAFTAGGQTLGKMAAGVRVVAADAGALDLGRAVVREMLWLALAAPVGLGLLTAVFSADHRGLHDRCAGTRVVREA